MSSAYICTLVQLIQSPLPHIWLFPSFPILHFFFPFRNPPNPSTEPSNSPRSKIHPSSALRHLGIGGQRVTAPPRFEALAWRPRPVDLGSRLSRRAHVSSDALPFPTPESRCCCCSGCLFDDGREVIGRSGESLSNSREAAAAIASHLGCIGGTVLAASLPPPRSRVSLPAQPPPRLRQLLQQPVPFARAAASPSVIGRRHCRWLRRLSRLRRRVVCCSHSPEVAGIGRLLPAVPSLSPPQLVARPVPCM